MSKLIDSKQSEVEIFKNEEFGSIRIMRIDNEPWFVGKDVAEALKYKNASKAVIIHVYEEDKRFEMLKASDSQNGNLIKTALINESGLYSLILSSKLPDAKKFKRWITSEVLPSIRKHGTYMISETIEKSLMNPDFIIQLATQLKEERQARKLAEQDIKAAEAVIDYQRKTINLKQDIVNGLIGNIDIYKKTDIINHICSWNNKNCAGRYKELYRCFAENYHIDLIDRCKRYNLRQEKKKDWLSVVRYAEKFGYIDNLYLCCVKLYQVEVKKFDEDAVC